MTRVIWVILDFGGLFEAAGAVDVLQGGERAADDPLGRLHHPLEGCLLRLCAAWEPHTNAVGEDTFHRAAIVRHQ